MQAEISELWERVTAGAVGHAARWVNFRKSVARMRTISRTLKRLVPDGDVTDVLLVLLEDEEVRQVNGKELVQRVLELFARHPDLQGKDYLRIYLARLLTQLATRPHGHDSADLGDGAAGADIEAEARFREDEEREGKVVEEEEDKEAAEEEEKVLDESELANAQTPAAASTEAAPAPEPAKADEKADQTSAAGATEAAASAAESARAERAAAGATNAAAPGKDTPNAGAPASALNVTHSEAASALDIHVAIFTIHVTLLDGTRDASSTRPDGVDVTFGKGFRSALHAVLVDGVQRRRTGGRERPLLITPSALVLEEPTRAAAWWGRAEVIVTACFREDGAKEDAEDVKHVVDEPWPTRMPKRLRSGVEVEAGPGTNILSELAWKLSTTGWEPQPGSSSSARCIFGLPDSVVTRVEKGDSPRALELDREIRKARIQDGEAERTAGEEEKVRKVKADAKAETEKEAARKAAEEAKAKRRRDARLSRDPESQEPREDEVAKKEEGAAAAAAKAKAAQEEDAADRRQRREHKLVAVEQAAEQVAAEMVDLLDGSELHKVFETPHHALILVADVSDVSSRFLRAAATFQLRAFLLACLDPTGDKQDELPPDLERLLETLEGFVGDEKLHELVTHPKQMPATLLRLLSKFNRELLGRVGTLILEPLLRTVSPAQNPPYSPPPPPLEPHDHGSSLRVATGARRSQAAVVDDQQDLQGARSLGRGTAPHREQPREDGSQREG